MNRELQPRDSVTAHREMGMCGGVRDKAEKEVYVSMRLKAQWESSLWQREGKKDEERWGERKNRVRQLRRQPNAYKFILLHY